MLFYMFLVPALVDLLIGFLLKKKIIGRGYECHTQNGRLIDYTQNERLIDYTQNERLIDYTQNERLIDLNAAFSNFGATNFMNVFPFTSKSGF